jgi:general secretion pathway protein I
VRATQSGFSLLEAIVAMVLVATVGMALFAWVNTNLLTLGRVRDVNQRSAASNNILEYMHSVNPMAAPQGQATLGSYRIRWSAKPETATIDRAQTNYQYALYQTRVQVEEASGNPWFELELRQVGYKRVREFKWEN